MTLLPWPDEFGPTFPTGLPLARPRINGSYAVAVAAIDTSPDAWGVNLSPPPFDAQGYPTRMDALPEVVARVARAMGLDPSEGVLFQRYGGDDGKAWKMTASGGTCHWFAPAEYQWLALYGAGFSVLPSLLPISDNRLAVAAIVAARPWSTA